MRIIKRLYLFILQSFLPLFAMTFFIVLFIVLMQFLWKYIDDLVGKGLEFSLIAELFFYAAVSLVPMALPLAILLASLMTFGNFGEKFELTAMKASGISLLKAMSPLIVLIAGISVGAFFFQNNILPHAQVKMWTLLFSMRQKSPELEIPEGVFYDQIPGYNLFVQHKNRETGILHQVMIYDVSHGGDNSTILMADSGLLAFTPDMKYLYLHLYQGQQFENLREQKSLDRNVPFRREEFAEKEVLIPFDANFNRLDEGGMRNQYVGKNMAELRHTIDSINVRLDSTGYIYGRELRRSAFPLLNTSERLAQLYDSPIRPSGPGSPSSGSSPRPASGSSSSSANHSSGGGSSSSADGAALKGGAGQSVSEEEKPAGIVPVDIDTLIASLPLSVKESIFSQATNMSQRQMTEMQFRALTIGEDKRVIRRHEIELLKKFTLSVACLVFFFIGAPLGAIIRKGGLGTPLVISVLLFLFYYIIDNTGYKMARDGHWAVWCGIWLSTFVLAPLGVYVTYKAMNDSAVFDGDRYKTLFRKLLGRKAERKVNYKEIIINDISEDEAISKLVRLRRRALGFTQAHSHRQTYGQYWSKGYSGAEILSIGEELEDLVEYMTDCRNPLAVNKLMDYPVVRNLWVYHPGDVKWLGVVLKWFALFGFPIYLFGLKAQRNLKEEMRHIAQVSAAIVEVLRPGESTSLLESATYGPDPLFPDSEYSEENGIEDNGHLYYEERPDDDASVFGKEDDERTEK